MAPRYLFISAIVLIANGGVSPESQAGEWGADGNTEEMTDFMVALSASTPTEGCRRLLSHAGGRNETPFVEFRKGPESHRLFNGPIFLGAFQPLAPTREKSVDGAIRPAFHCISAADAFRVLVNHPRQFALFIAPGSDQESRGLVAQIPTRQWAREVAPSAAKDRPRCMIDPGDPCMDFECAFHCRKLSQFASWQTIENEADLKLLTEVALMTGTFVYRLEGKGTIALREGASMPPKSIDWLLSSGSERVHLGLFLESLSFGTVRFPEGLPQTYFGLRLINSLSEDRRALRMMPEEAAIAAVRAAFSKE